MDNLSASWKAFDPDNSITRYQYIIGTTLDGADVISWTDTIDTRFELSSLTLTLV